MAKITYKIIERPDGNLNLVAPLVYVEFDEPIDRFDVVNVLKNLNGSDVYEYRDDDGFVFCLTAADKEIIDSLWFRNNGPLRIYIRESNRLGQLDTKCHMCDFGLDCTKCPDIIPFGRFGGDNNLYYCTRCPEDKNKTML